MHNIFSPPEKEPRQKITRTFFLYILFSFLVMGCYAKRPVSFKPSAEVFRNIPPWVKRCPVDEKGEWLYAVGYSSPTFYYKDAVEKAENDARIELAKQIKVQIKGVMLDVMVNERRIVGDHDYIISVSETIVDNVMENSKIIATWHDKYGLIGEKGSVYALARTKSKNVKKKVGEVLRR